MLNVYRVRTGLILYVVLHLAVSAIVFLLLVHTAHLDISLSDSSSGFLLKSNTEQTADTSTFYNQRQLFAQIRLSSSFYVRASHGTFTAEEKVPPHLSENLKFSGSGYLPLNSSEGLDLSAHLVSESITSDRPVLQVLFHAMRLPPSDSRTASEDTISFSLTASTQKWCVYAHVYKGLQQYSSSCILNGSGKDYNNICLADVWLPASWWDEEALSAQVFFSVEAKSGPQQRCSEFHSNQSVDYSKERYHLSAVSLIHGQVSYEELKEDQHVLIHIPQGSFFPGSKFRVPVKLQADSDLDSFVIKSRARHGIQVLGAETKNTSGWQIKVDLDHKLHGAVVTAKLMDSVFTRRLISEQDVFDWIFEVEDSASGEERGRINFIVEYEARTARKNEFRSVENKIVARVEIQRDNTFAIVPIIKMTEMINTAILTGKAINYPMRIFSVSHTRRLLDITSQTTCHSDDQDILKVTETCNWVYVDGTETKGSPSVTVIAKYGRNTRFLLFRIWFPNFPVDVSLSDKLLNKVKGWKVPRSASAVGRPARGLDAAVLTHTGLSEDELSDNEDGAEDCDLRYQTAVVEAHTGFYVSDSRYSQQLVNDKALFKVTNLVHLRAADPTVVQLDQNVVKGLKPGHTTVQALSRLGRVVGSVEVTVLEERTEAISLQTHLVSGLSLSISLSDELHGAFVANVKLGSHLRHKYQEAALDISVVYDDGTTLPLRYISPDQYSLTVDSLNSRVVTVGPMYSPDTPSVVALGPGKGELLRVSLELIDACQRKKGRALVTGRPRVDVSFTSESGDTEQNDAAHSGIDRRAESSLGGRDVLHLSLNSGQSKSGRRDSKELSYPDSDSKSAQQFSVSTSQGLTTLETVMYVLLGVFCIALAVFTINCAVFGARRRRRYTKPPANGGKDVISCAPDWIWIGRETLQRNAVNVECSRALISATDFGGHPNGVVVRDVPVCGSNRNSACLNGGSNRNSMVSTYQGAECNVCLATNPLPVSAAHDSRNPERDFHSHTLPRFIKPKPPCDDDFSFNTHDLKELSDLSRASSTVSAFGTYRRPRLDSRNAASREEKLKQIEEALASGSEVEFDHEALGMSYTELMRYFDNLKETAA